jgi:hypothetical protein
MSRLLLATSTKFSQAARTSSRSWSHPAHTGRSSSITAPHTGHASGSAFSMRGRLLPGEAGT